MKTTAQSLNEELGTDLLSQLSTEDQREVDQLNDQVTFLTNENRAALKERIQVLYKTYAWLLWNKDKWNAYHSTWLLYYVLALDENITNHFCEVVNGHICVSSKIDMNLLLL